jgi:hypothetical protein
LEDIIGAPVHGYRAPNFSISDDTLKLIEECGYTYDSSYNSFDKNERYGRPDFSLTSKIGIVFTVSRSFYEIPISNLQLPGIRNIIPWGGGGYFRFLPFFVFKQGIRSILEKENAYVFYMHPWEIDPNQPKVKQASPLFKFRHYLNLRKTGDRLQKLIAAFDQNRFTTCSELILSIESSND